MAFQKFHGITLANNSFIENFHVERLAADPVPLTAGRFWVNTTERKVKYSTLDGTGAVIVRSFAAAEDAVSGLAEAKAYTDQAITDLKGVAPELLDTLGEIATALNNDPNVYNTLVAMIGTNIEAAKAEIRGAVSEEFDTLAEVEATVVRIDGDAATTGSFRNAIAAETTARQAADTTQQGQINTLISDVDAVEAAVAAEVAARQAGDSALDARLTTVEAQANGKIGDLTTLTTTEKGTIVGAINEVDADLAAETTARQAGDTAEASARAAAVTALQAADTALQSAVDAEVARATAAEGNLAGLTTTAKTSLVAAINEVDADLAAEVAARAAADTALQAALGAEVARATGVEGSLATLTTTAKGTLVAAINELDAEVAALTNGNQTTLDAEIAARQAGDAALQTALDAEVAAREAADAAEVAAREAADAALATAIGDASANARGELNDLVDELNARVHKFSGMTASTHVITHNLGDDIVDVQVWVKGDDSIFRNDMVAIEVTSNNVVTISMTESREIKGFVESKGQLSEFGGA